MAPRTPAVQEIEALPEADRLDIAASARDACCTAMRR
jgi:hypothetical protein